MRYLKFEVKLFLLASALLCLALPMHAAGQESELAEEAAGQEPMRTVIKQTRYVDVEELQPILQMLGIQIRLKADVNAIVLRGRPDTMETALALIENLDVPPEPDQSIEVSAYVVAASKEKSSKSVPAGLESTVDQLEQIFGYRGFELLDTVFLRVRNGRKGRLEGGISFDETSDALTAYQLTFNQVEVIPQEEGPRVVRLDGLTFELNGAHAGQVQRAYLRTDVEVREGQKAVVGKSTPRGTGGTLILIVEAKVLE